MMAACQALSERCTQGRGRAVQAEDSGVHSHVRAEGQEEESWGGAPRRRRVIEINDDGGGGCGGEGGGEEGVEQRRDGQDDGRLDAAVGDGER